MSSKIQDKWMLSPDCMVPDIYSGSQLSQIHNEILFTVYASLS